MRFLSLRVVIPFLSLCLLPLTPIWAGNAFSPKPPAPPSDLVEVSLGLDYLHLGDAYPEHPDLLGFNISVFVNTTSWLSLGAEFSGDFGKETYHNSFPFPDTEVTSQRWFYVAGPRFTIWQDSNFKAFIEALAGGVSAQAEVTRGSFDRTAHETDVAAVLGGGFDWRLTDHFSWRIIQADYVGTHLGSDWQNNFRLSSSIVYSFGRR